MHSLLASAVVAAGLVTPLGLFSQRTPGAFVGAAGFHRSFPAPPRTPGAGQIRPAALVTSPAGPGSPPPPKTSTGDSIEPAGHLNVVYTRSWSWPWWRQNWGSAPVIPVGSPETEDQTDQSAEPPPAPNEDSQLAGQVDNLTKEVESMREGQACQDSDAAPPVEPPVKSQEIPPPTLVVYRDGHQTEIQNYAILGNTLWIFSDQTARRVPLDELDLAATRRVNGEKGMDFVAPVSR